MARHINRLTELKIKSLHLPGRYADGGNLYFLISPGGSRSWVFRYRDRITGNRRDKGLGAVRDLPLAMARQIAAEYRRQLLVGIDPIDNSRALKTAARLERAKALTFGQCVEKYISAHRASWRNAKHADQWSSTLHTYCENLLPLPVNAVDTSLVVNSLESIWSTKTETATRVRQRIEAVLDWATVRGFRVGPNPASWRGHLDKLLPAPAKLKAVQHRPALPYIEIAEFMAELRNQRGLPAKALELQILTACRPAEVTNAQWSEFDLDQATWTVPAARTKSSRDHRIPLCESVLKLIKSLPRFGEHLFPGARITRPVTTMTVLKVAQTLRPGITSHGFRSSFRDWAADCTNYPREIAEECLAHVLKDKTEAAYRRSDLFEKRRRLMADWARYCETAVVDVAEVIPIRKSISR